MSIKTIENFFIVFAQLYILEMRLYENIKKNIGKIGKRYKNFRRKVIKKPRLIARRGELYKDFAQYYFLNETVIKIFTHVIKYDVIVNSIYLLLSKY